MRPPRLPSTVADQPDPDSAPAGGTQAPVAHTQAAGAALDSQTLLQGRPSVAIQHNGVVYRLQATKLGKLILTK